MKVKARLEFKLVRDVKDNNRRTKEIMALLLNGAEHLVAKDMEKTISVTSLTARCGLGDARLLWTVAKLG